MKNIEQKAKAYDEAIKRTKAMIKIAANQDEAIGFANTIFPELRKSEDEKIRHAIDGALQNKTSIEYLNALGVTFQDAHNWLEKQGELPHWKKSTLPNDDVTGFNSDYFTHNGYYINYKELFNKLPKDNFDLKKQGANSVTITKGNTSVTNAEVVSYSTTSTTFKPKFKVGDFIMNDYCMGRVVELTNDAYLLDTEQGIPFSYEHNVHLWTIEDAKDGDIIYIKSRGDDSEWLLIFKKIKSQNNYIDVYDYCALSITGNHLYHDSNGLWGLLLDGSIVRPATKEQCNLLFAKMKEEGYEWDDKEKDLKKISQEYPLTPDKCIKSITWNEEDEEMFNFILKELDLYCDSNKIRKIIDWLKSIKKRIK